MHEPIGAQLPGINRVMLSILNRLGEVFPPMFSVKLARILGPIAAVFLILGLSGCGGAAGSSHQFIQISGPSITSQPVGPEITTPQTVTLTVTASGSGTLSYQWYQGPTGTIANPISGATSSSYTTLVSKTTSYWVQVSDSNGGTNSNTAVVLIVGKGAVQALLFSLAIQLPPATFITDVLPNITGVSVALPWSQVETSQGVYDFTSFDATLQPYASRQVNLIVWPATEGGNNDPYTPNQGSTPAYVFSPEWASDPSVNAPNPQDMAVCSSYTGDSGNPYAGTGGGAWNINTSSDLSGLPVSYETPFMVAYQNFIKAVIAHYNLPTSPKIGYIRFGFS